MARDDHPIRSRGFSRWFVPRGMIRGVSRRPSAIPDPLDDVMRMMGIPVHDQRSADAELHGYLRGR